MHPGNMVDMGDHFRLICADIELVKQPKPMPKLPVARIMYRHKPNFQIVRLHGATQAALITPLYLPL